MTNLPGKRPWPAGIGWVIAVIVLVLAVLSLVVPVTMTNLEIWLIIGLCLAILL